MWYDSLQKENSMGKNNTSTAGMDKINSMSSTEIAERISSAIRQRKSKITAHQKERLASIPSRFQGLYLKSCCGELGPTQAIKLKCIDCCGFEDVKENVGGCVDTSCSLHRFRPYQN